VRFLIGQFSHESNCFCAHTTGEAEFRQWDLGHGAEVIESHRGKQTVVGGFIEGLARDGHEAVGSVAAMAVPSGPIEAGFYRQVKGDLLEAVRQAGELDGVLLSLHGAMSVEEAGGVEDPEGDLVAAVRQAAGPGVPIVAVLDLHSDTTELLLQSTDLTLAFNEEPHRDAYERGLEAAALIQRIRRGEIWPMAARERVPMLLPAINMATDQGPMRALHELRADLEQRPGVLDLSIHAGFYGADQPEVGFSVVCTTDGQPDLARRLARQVGEAAWQRREEFLVPAIPIDEAVRQAMALPGPVGLIDEADDPAGGAPADSVEILRGMLRAGVPSGGISTVTDTEVARRMASAGEGARLDTWLGAKTDHLHGEPIEVEGRVVKVHREPIPMDGWSGRLWDVGIVGVLEVRGVLVVVTETKIVAENVDIFEILGFDVRTLKVVSFKGLGLHIRQMLAGKIETCLTVDGVGVTHPDVRKLGPYRRVRRPVWPLDEMAPEAYPAG
jgi:microcystin degradation protein MlrC